MAQYIKNRERSSAHAKRKWKGVSDSLIRRRPHSQGNAPHKAFSDGKHVPVCYKAIQTILLV
jgi:hypothetical protein